MEGECGFGCELEGECEFGCELEGECECEFECGFEEEEEDWCTQLQPALGPSSVVEEARCEKSGFSDSEVVFHTLDPSLKTLPRKRWSIPMCGIPVVMEVEVEVEVVCGM